MCNFCKDSIYIFANGYLQVIKSQLLKINNEAVKEITIQLEQYNAKLIIITTTKHSLLTCQFPLTKIKKQPYQSILIIPIFEKILILTFHPQYNTISQHTPQ